VRRFGSYEGKAVHRSASSAPGKRAVRSWHLMFIS
jgi:hypothetical protein